MMASLKLVASVAALGLATSAASAQTVISQSITAEPVETTVTQTPTGTIVTRRPLGEQPAALVAPQVAAPAFAQPTVPAATFVDTGPDTIDVFTTRQVVRRAEAERDRPPMVTRQVSAPRMFAAQRTHTRRVSTMLRQRPPVQQTTRVVRETRQVALRQPTPRLVLNPRERQIIYRTIIDREVIPRQQVIVAPSVAPASAYVAPRVVPPVVAADETVVTAPITVGTVLPANVPLYAMPQNVALTVPATQAYSYAWLGGRAYLVEPASGTVVADLTD
ncbi:MAG: DUF1236 domain-containing protein [Xanthobacteraceae bacterium]